MWGWAGLAPSAGGRAGAGDKDVLGKTAERQTQVRPLTWAPLPFVLFKVILHKHSLCSSNGDGNRTARPLACSTPLCLYQEP